jgi:hypothetical protein
VEFELERGRDPEVPAAAEPPEQLGLVVCIGADLLALGENEVDRLEVVYREAEGAHQVPDPAAQGQATNAGGWPRWPT